MLCNHTHNLSSLWSFGDHYPVLAGCKTQVQLSRECAETTLSHSSRKLGHISAGAGAHGKPVTVDFTAMNRLTGGEHKDTCVNMRRHPADLTVCILRSHFLANRITPPSVPGRVSPAAPTTWFLSRTKPCEIFTGAAPQLASGIACFCPCP